MLALALGAQDASRCNGHRGANQPVKDLATGKVEITSQNHGFAVDRTACPTAVERDPHQPERRHRRGLAPDRTGRSSRVQYHPEASPGPHDSYYLFERFVEMMKTK